MVGTRTEAGSRPSGNLVATRTGVTRLRTALEGSKSTTIATRMASTPSVELGIRQDGGNAEVGRGRGERRYSRCRRNESIDEQWPRPAVLDRRRASGMNPSGPPRTT